MSTETTTMASYKPEPGVIGIGYSYTLSEIKKANLYKTVRLSVRLKNVQNHTVTAVIQPEADSTIDLLEKTLKNTKFVYVRTLPDWTPVFVFGGGEEEILPFLNKEIELDPYANQSTPLGVWLTPKGSEHTQYFTYDKETSTLNGLADYEHFPLPDSLKPYENELTTDCV